MLLTRKGVSSLYTPPPGSCQGDCLRLGSEEGRKGFRVTFFSAVLRVTVLQMTLPPLWGFTGGCFQLIVGLCNYGDYSSWLFPSLHLCFQIYRGLSLNMAILQSFNKIFFSLTWKKVQSWWLVVWIYPYASGLHLFHKE